MGRKFLSKGAILALFSTSIISSTALAGGFDRGAVNIDQLFDRDKVSTSARVTYVNPQREINNVTRPALTGTPLAGFNGASIDVDSDFFVPRIGVKTTVAPGVDCLATYTEPFGGDASYGTGNIFSPSTVEFFLDTQDYGLTCSYQFSAGDTSLGDSYIRVIAGGSYLEAEGFLSRQSFLFGSALLGVAPLTELGLGTFEIEDETFGWRAGLAYEIPEIALNATILYSSRYDLDLTGTQTNSGFSTLSPLQLGAIGGPTIPIALGGAEIPQALDIKFQSGINETTLAFLNLRWQDWSQLQILPVINTTTGLPTGSTLDTSYEDGYTATLGFGKELSDNFSSLASLTWDRGTSTIVGTQTDTWTLSGGLRYKEGENFRVNIGGAIGILEGGSSAINPANPDPSSAVTFDFDADIVYAITAGAKLRF
ncbi:MAG: outer membrane protein transport protein [Pseudomonadota bacterium]